MTKGLFAVYGVVMMWLAAPLESAAMWCFGAVAILAAIVYTVQERIR